MEFGEPVKLSDGRYFVKASTGGSPVYVSLKNTVIFDPNSTEEISLKISDQDVDTVGQWDQKCIDNAFENSVKWFHKEISSDVIRSYFQSSLDGQVLDVMPSVNAKGKVNTAYFDPAKNQIQSIDENTNASVLLQLDGLWFLRKTFGPLWRLVQVRVKKTTEPVQCMLDDDSD